MLDGEKSLIVVPQEGISSDIFEVLGRVRNFTSAVSSETYWDQKSESKPPVDEDLMKIREFLSDRGGTYDVRPNYHIRSGISMAAYTLFQKLEKVQLRVGPLAVSPIELPITIQIIGKAGIGSPEIKADLLRLYHKGWDYSKEENPNQIITNSAFAAEALGKIYGAEAYQDLLNYRSSSQYSPHYSKDIGRDVSVYESVILQGAILGFAGTNLPEAVREIFSILKMRSPNRFAATKVPVPDNAVLYSGREFEETAVDALSTMDPKVIRQAIDTSSVSDLADLLTNYHDQGKESCGNYQPEILYKLVLPYFSPAKIIEVLKVTPGDVTEEVVLFLPYGLKADVVELARMEKLAIPNLDQWDVEDLRRKQKKLDATSTSWQETCLTDDEVKTLLADIDKTIEGAGKGPILGFSRKTYFLEDIAKIRAVAPEIDAFINGKTIEERIAAARKLQDRRVQVKLLDAAMDSFGSISDEFEIMERVLTGIFGLNKSFAIYHLCQNLVGNREEKVYHAQYYSPRYLALLGDSRACPYLAAQAINGALPRERWKAMEALGELGDPWAAEFLVDIYQHSRDDYMLKGIAMKTIGKMRTPNVAEFVREIGRDATNPVLRYEVLLASAQAGDKDAVTSLLDFTEKYQGFDPEYIEARLWKILLPKAEYENEDSSADAYWYRLAVRRIAKNTINRLLGMDAEKTKRVGSYIMHFYSDETHEHINHLFERFTSLPIGIARQYIDSALPDDKQLMGFIFRIIPSARLYPEMLQILLSDRTKRILSTLNERERKAFYNSLGFPASWADGEPVAEEKEVNPKEITLSTGMKIETKGPYDKIVIYPHSEIEEELVKLVKESGVSDSTLQSVAQISRDHFERKLKRALPVVHVNTIPHDLIMGLPTGKPHTRMISGLHPVFGLHIGISRENSVGMTSQEFVSGIIHEIYANILLPEVMVQNQLEIQGYSNALYASHVPFLGEGLANFELGIPLNRELLIAYANGLRDDNFDDVLRRRGVRNKSDIRATRDDWFNNPHIIGSFLCDVFSRVNPQQMWEYVLSFFDRNLNGDYSVQSLQKVNIAQIMYDDYVKLSNFLGEIPYPKNVFIRDMK